MTDQKEHSLLEIQDQEAFAHAQIYATVDEINKNVYHNTLTEQGISNWLVQFLFDGEHSITREEEAFKATDNLARALLDYYETMQDILLETTEMS